jgi:uncharacterized protein YqgV (UPF0045/DUF77 family)
VPRVNVSFQVLPIVKEERVYEIVDKVIICIKEGVPRVVSIVKIDYKPEGVTIDEKVKKYRN